MQVIELEVKLITQEVISNNHNIRLSDIGKYGIFQKGFDRVIELSLTESECNDLVKSCYKYQELQLCNL